MVMPSQLIPPEVLTICQNEVAATFDSLVDWWPAGPPDEHGDRTYPSAPVILPGRIVKETQEFYTTQGQQAAVTVNLIYLPQGAPLLAALAAQTPPYTKVFQVTAADKLVEHGIDVSNTWPTIIEITPMPTPTEPIQLRVRQGAA